MAGPMMAEGDRMDDARLNSLRAAVAAAPEEPSLRILLAGALMERGLVDEAATEYGEALRLRPNDGEALYGLAVALARRGDLNRAMATLDQLVGAHGEAASERMLRARIAFQAGDTKRAVEAYRRAVEMDPNLSDPAFDEMLGIDGGADDEIVDGRIRQRVEAPDIGPFAELERPQIAFADVGGMDEVKQEIRRRIIAPMQQPEVYKAYGQRVGGGLLLYGPPGCGKTYLARATAGEVKAAFFNIGIHQILDMWIGASERNLHEVFEVARANRPAVLFFDEVDALAASRSDMRTSSGRHLINQFLAELDGVDGQNDGLLIMGATNAPWHLDAAFRRPGRFDQVVFVPPPDAEARTAILKVLLRERPTRSIDYAKVAGRSDRFSGADLRGLVEAAVGKRLDEAIRTGDPQPVETDDLLAAMKGFRPSTGDWFATARNYVLYANDSGLYDAVRPYLKL
jgi:transitional endoplasmic reticulum ATPase